MSTVLQLHRLLKRKEMTAMLTEFIKLMPESRLAIIRDDGKLFVRVGEWSSRECETVFGYLDGRLGLIEFDAYMLYPLVIDGYPLGLLVGHGSLNVTAFNCLYQSLFLLLTEASEKRSLANEALDRYREINLLYQIAEKVGRNLNPDTIPELVLTEATRVIESDVGAILLPPGPDSKKLEIKSWFGYQFQSEMEDDVTRYVIDHVYETGQPEIFTALSLASSSVDAVLCAPLRIREETSGVILLGRRPRYAMFTASDEKLLTAIASQTVIAIDTAWLHQQEIRRQRLDKELAVGQQIQLSLLPESTPTLPGWAFAAIYQAARLVGGDFYDFFELPGRRSRIGLLIADVTGKGVPAALFMAFSRAIIRTTALSGDSPATVLQRANQLIVSDNRSGIYLTAFYAILELDTGLLTFASAGHNWPLYISAGPTCQELAAGGFLLGALPDIFLEEHSVMLAENDVVVFFTDGVPEAMNAAGEMFGEELLHHVGQTHAAETADGILNAVVEAVHDFTGDIPQSDDFTMVVVKRTAIEKE